MRKKWTQFFSCIAIILSLLYLYVPALRAVAKPKFNKPAVASKRPLKAPKKASVPIKQVYDEESEENEGDEESSDVADKSEADDDEDEDAEPDDGDDEQMASDEDEEYGENDDADEEESVSDMEDEEDTVMDGDDDEDEDTDASDEEDPGDDQVSAWTIIPAIFSNHIKLRQRT